MKDEVVEFTFLGEGKSLEEKTPMAAGIKELVAYLNAAAAPSCE